MIRTKSKAKKGKNTEVLKCEFSDCENNDEDALIKCNSCGKWLCDSCSEARISKLKPVVTSCPTIFFACSCCAKTSGESGFAINKTKKYEQDTVVDQSTVSDVLVTSMESILKDHVSKLEETIENMIEKKLNEKLPVASNDGEQNSTQQESYAHKLLQVPVEVRKVIKEAKNEERVEENEQEKRAKNFIVHGAEEIGVMTSPRKRTTPSTSMTY